jgi:O-antigen/teichoic acid export membrane protein
MIRLKQDVNDLIRLALPLLMVAGISLALSCNFYNREIIDLLYKAHASYSSRILGILMIGFLFVSTSYIYGTLLTANNNLKYLNLLAAATVVINISLNLILIPRHQALGAAVSSLVSQGFYAILQIALARRLLKIPLNGDIFLRITLFLAVNVAAGFFTLQIPGWIPGFFTLLVSCLVTSLLLRLIKPSQLVSVIRNDR